MLKIVHHPDFEAAIGRSHRFPMPKYGFIIRFLEEDGLVVPGVSPRPEPAEFDQVCLAHDKAYVRQVFDAAVDPKIEREIGFAVNDSVSLRARLSCAATLLAGRIALEEGIATTAAGGSHHARRERGAGFCVFNDVGIAAANLLFEGEIGSALVFDCDVHQGDGTAEIFAREPRVTTVSIHNEKNYPVRKVPSDLDVGLEDDIGDLEYLEVLGETLDRSLLLNPAPGIVFYNAGVDPHAEDRLGRMAMTDDGLAARDRKVIAFFRERDIPVVCVQGGGYSSDVEAVARRHTIVHRVAAQFAGGISP